MRTTSVYHLNCIVNLNNYLRSIQINHSLIKIVLKVMTDNTMIFMTLSSPEKRSISPMTPSPSRGMKGIRLFRAISKKLTRKSKENLSGEEEDDSRSSSTDSCSSTSISRCSRSKKLEHLSTSSSGLRSESSHRLSSSSVSDAGSGIQIKNRRRYSTSAESIRNVFQNLSINSRSKSCNNNKEKKKNKKNPPKKILRPPVRYIYMKGWSGLPTQRIPITVSRSYVNNSCGYNMQYMTR